MRRREFIVGLGGAAAWPLAARTQQTDRVRRLAVLMNGAAAETELQSLLAAVTQRLSQLGWIEGQNLRIDVRWNAGNADLARSYAAQLIGLMPDVILAMSTVNLMAIREATSTVPVVFTNLYDPVAQGFVASMRQPGGNLTGFSYLEFSIGSKWLGLLKQVAPGLARVGVIVNETTPYSKFFMPATEAAAPSLGVKAIAVVVNSSAEIEPAVEGFARQPNGGLMLLGDSFTRLHQKLFADLSSRFHLPAIASAWGFAKDGGLMEYGSEINLLAQYREAATYVDQILRGARPGDLPIQAPTHYRLVVNLKTAKVLRLTIPDQLLLAADEVIE